MKSAGAAMRMTTEMLEPSPSIALEGLRDEMLVDGSRTSLIFAQLRSLSHPPRNGAAVGLPHTPPRDVGPGCQADDARASAADATDMMTRQAHEVVAAAAAARRRHLRDIWAFRALKSACNTPIERTLCPRSSGLRAATASSGIERDTRSDFDRDSVRGRWWRQIQAEGE